ncbi:hypothetical protein PHMEG_00041561, partial [Phytophthora megakarya]
PKVRTGLSRKLAHLWYGPFRIDEIHDDFRVKLKIPGTGYRVNPWVHISRLEPRALFPKRPTSEIQVSEDGDFDAALPPEDSWDPDTAQDEYEVEEILDLSYLDPEWIPLAQLNCGALLYEFDQSAKAKARFQDMQAGDDHPGN